MNLPRPKKLSKALIARVACTHVAELNRYIRDPMSIGPRLRARLEATFIDLQVTRAELKIHAPKRKTCPEDASKRAAT